MDNNTSESSQPPKLSDYPGLTEHMAATFAAVAALPDDQLKARSASLLENASLEKALVAFRDRSPEKAAGQLGVSVEAVEKMSPEEMMAQTKRHTEQMPAEELRSQIVEAQQRFAAMLPQKETGENEAGSSAG